MRRSATPRPLRRNRERGFSLMELAISLTILVVLSAMAIPSILQSLRSYQLNDAATRLSDILKITRFEAVRRNKRVDLCIQQNGAYWNVWTDADQDGVMEPTEKQSMVYGFATLLPPTGMPGTGPITATLGGVTVLDSSKSGSNGTITFDARGAVTTLTAYIFYLGNALNPQYGYRCVILLPSGATQIWMAPPGGTWQRLS